MARKSAAAMKVTKKAPEVDTVKEFEKMIGALSNMVDTKVILSKGIRTALELKQEMEGFFKEPVTIEGIRFWQKDTTKVYEEIAEVLNGIEYEKFIADDYKDPFEKLIDASGYEDWNDLFAAHLRFSAVLPFADKLNQLRRLILETIEEQK